MSSSVSSLSRTGSLQLGGPRVPFDTGSISGSSDNYVGSNTWTIKKFSHIKERKMFSEEFEIGTYSWRLLLFPKGNDNRDKSKNSGAAVYLRFAHASITPDFLNPRVKFQITVLNSKYPAKSISLGAEHTFSKRSPDWGFTHILLKEELQDTDYGFLEKDTLVFRVDLTVIPRHMPRNETGFVGLSAREGVNGLNPVLQVLFHLPYFRKAIYNVNSAETVATGTRLPHALRRLFFKLQYQNSTVGTKEIVRILDHCDVQRRFSNLLDKLMLELMGSNVESVIPNLFDGRSLTFIESALDGETKTVAETYKQVDLDVAGCKDMYEALERRCKVVRVEGSKNEHRYKLFDTLPSILHIQFRYAGKNPEIPEQGCLPFAIIEDLNMDYGGKRFFTPGSGTSAVKNAYKLHSVFVHRYTGSCYVYIKRQDTWFKFEDEQVNEVDEEEVYEPHLRDPGCIAHGLLYIRTSDRAQILWETGKDDIAQNIRRNLEDSLLEKERNLTEKQTANSYVCINVATESDFHRRCLSTRPTDLVDLDTVKQYRIHKDANLEAFRSIVAADFKTSPSAQRYWLWRRGENSSPVLDKIFPTLAQENKKLISLHSVRDPLWSSDKKNNSLMVINVFLELPQPEETTLHEIQKDEILLFFKFYDPLKAELDYVGSMYVPKKMYFATILDKAKKLANVHKDLDITAAKIAALEPSVVTCEIFAQSTPAQNDLESGDVVIIQPKMMTLNAFLKQAGQRSEFEDDSKLGKM